MPMVEQIIAFLVEGTTKATVVLAKVVQARRMEDTFITTVNCNKNCNPTEKVEENQFQSIQRIYKIK